MGPPERCTIKRIGVALAALAALAIALERSLAWMLRTQPQRAIHLTRRLFGKVVNPVFRWVSDRLHVDQTVLYHVGRKSGRTYVTPLCVSPVAEGYILPAALGPGVDWLANLRATPRARLHFEGADHLVDAEIIDYDRALKEAGDGPHCPCWEYYRIENYALLRPVAGQALEPHPVSPGITS